MNGITRALARSASIATVSEATRDAVIANWPNAHARTFVTPSGVSGAFQPALVDPSALAALGLTPGRRFVLTVGQFAPYKNHAGALRAFALASAGRNDIDLVFVQRQGDGANTLLALAENLGVRGQIHILPALAQNELIQLYSSAALLLHPSFCEGFGHPLAEAMACGCPVVTSDRSSMPEVTAEAALQIDPNDTPAIAMAVSRVLNDASVADEMRQRGRARASQLRWEDFAQANLTLYRQVLSNQ